MTLTGIITRAEKILIVGHKRPDGDCFGAGLALRHLALRMGKKADFVCDSTLSPHYAFLPDFDKINILSYEKYDTVIAVDCGDLLRLGKYCAELKNATYTVNIDHHLIKSTFAQENIVQSDACSTCLIIAEMAFAEDLMDDYLAYMLFVGLSTDTGHFMHSNTSGKVFALASRLCDYNIDVPQIVRDLYKSRTKDATILIARAIGSMRFFGGLCIMVITESDLIDCRCDIDDTEGLIDYAMAIQGVEAAVCITESEPRKYKVSFRSKNVDVSQAAAVFGGGGHKHASGCLLVGELKDAIEKIKTAVFGVME